MLRFVTKILDSPVLFEEEIYCWFDQLVSSNFLFFCQLTNEPHFSQGMFNFDYKVSLLLVLLLAPFFFYFI